MANKLVGKDPVSANINEVTVDHTGRMYTRSVVEDSSIEALFAGDRHAVSSGLKVLTSANASAMLLFINTGTETLFLDRLIVGSKDSTGGTEDFYTVTINKSATAIVGGSGSPTTINTNFGSSKDIANSSTIEAGAEGATLTGATSLVSFFFKTGITSFESLRIALPQGASIAFQVTPPAGNTSLACSVAINVHPVVI